MDNGQSHEKRRSEPEKRFEKLTKKLGIQIIKRNDKQNGKRIYFHNNEKLKTVIIKSDGEPLIDKGDRDKRPKSFHYIKPDYILTTKQNYFIEVKGNINEKNWNCSRENLNDHIRFALLRNRFKAIDLKIINYESLKPHEKEKVNKTFKPFPRQDPKERVYLEFDDLKRTVSKPNDNLIVDTLQLGGQQLTVKRINYEPRKTIPTIYIVDNEIMDLWEKRRKTSSNR